MTPVKFINKDTLKCIMTNGVTNLFKKILFSSTTSNAAAIAHTPGTGLPWSVTFSRNELDNNAPWTNLFITNNSTEDIKVFIPKKEYPLAEYLVFAGERVGLSFKDGDPLVYQLDIENQDGASDIAIGEIVINYNNKTTDIERDEVS